MTTQFGAETMPLGLRQLERSFTPDFELMPAMAQREVRISATPHQDSKLT